MSLDINAAAVIKAIAGAPQVFKDVGADMTKFAHAAVLKQIKAKGANIARLCDVHRVIGADAFLLIIEGVPDDGKSLKAIVGKFDKYCPELDTAKAVWLRQHLVALASGAASPAAKPAKETTKKKTAGDAPKRKTPAKRAISSKAFTATWDGKDREE